MSNTPEGSNAPANLSGAENTPAEPQRFINEDTPEVPATAKDKAEFIDEQIELYKQIGHTDEILWQDVRRDFARWNQDDFIGINPNKRGTLRAFLRDRGVYMDTEKPLGASYSSLMDEKQPREWPAADLELQLRTNLRFISRRKSPIVQQSVLLQPNQQKQVQTPALTERTGQRRRIFVPVRGAGYKLAISSSDIRMS